MKKEASEKFQAKDDRVFENSQEQVELEREAKDELGIDDSLEDWSTEIVPHFTEEEVEKLVNELRDGRAPGYDFINARMIKNGGKYLTKALVKIFNAIIDEGEVPECLNQGIMNLIPKERSTLTLKQQRP